MPETTHTRGPWLALTDRRNKRGQELPPAVITQAEGWINGQLVATCNTTSRVEIYANARLIAAAPDLLAALKEVNAALGEERIADVWPTTPDWYPRVLAAIAKAEGR